MDWEEATALDFFAGTGSISLELLPRGCQQVIGIEKDRDHVRLTSQRMEKLDTDEHILIRGNVLRFLKSCHQKFDPISAGLPYILPELDTIPDLTSQYDLLREDGLLVFEHGKANDFSTHPYFIEHGSYGGVNFTLLRQISPLDSSVFKKK